MVSGTAEGPIISVPTATTSGATRSVRGTIGAPLAAASAVGSSIARLVRPGGGDGAPQEVTNDGLGIAPPTTPQSHTGWGRSLLPLSALLILGSIVMILIGAILRRRAVRLAGDEARAFGGADFPDLLEGLVGISAEETNDDSADHAAWDLYAPPSP
jgi:hypothetical protein